MAEKISDEVLLYSNISEYLDGNLDDTAKERVEELLAQAGSDKFKTKFADYKDHLQSSFMTHYLSEAQRMELTGKGVTVDARKLGEKTESKYLQKIEDRATFWRMGFIGFLAILAIGAAYTMFAKKTFVVDNFEPLDHLSWEARAFEDDPFARLDFPSESYEEVSDFLQSYPSLPFKPVVLDPKLMGKGFRLLGAAVIDYEPRKVTVVAYEDKLNDVLLHFQFKGNMKNLPDSKRISTPELTYSMYTSDDHNVIVWEGENSTLSFFTGKDDPKKLASYAKSGMTKLY